MSAVLAIVQALPAKPIPATLKCPEPNLTSLLEDALDAAHSFGMECARDKNAYDYGDEPDTRKLFAEVKRLEAAGESLGEILETTTGALLVLSLNQELVQAAQAVAAWWQTFASEGPADAVIEDAEWGEFRALRKAIASATSPDSVEAVAKFADAVKGAGKS